MCIIIEKKCLYVLMLLRKDIINVTQKILNLEMLDILGGVYLDQQILNVMLHV